MKKIMPACLVFLFLFMNFGGCLPANAATPDKAIPIFNGQLALTADRRYNDVRTVANGWVAVGELYTAQGDALIAQFDTQGNEVWEQSFGGSDWDEADTVTEVSGGYIVSASCASNDGDLSGLKQDTAGIKTGVTAKYDKNGNLLWIKELSLSAAVGNDGGFIAVCGDKSAAGADDALSLVQFDADGNVVWTKPMGDSLNLYDNTNTLMISKMFKQPDGYLLFGTTSLVDSSFGDAQSGPGFMASLSADGMVLWQKALSVDQISDVIVTTDGILALGMTFADIPEACIEKYDFSLNLMWETRYKPSDGQVTLNKALEVGTDFYITGGMFDNPSKAFIIGIDESGNLFWDTGLQGDDADSVSYTNIFLTDKGFAVQESGSYSGQCSFLLYIVPAKANTRHMGIAAEIALWGLCAAIVVGGIVASLPIKWGAKGKKRKSLSKRRS